MLDLRKLERKKSCFLITVCLTINSSFKIHRLLGIAGGRIIYVESIARVYRLSLTGKILYHCRIADQFFVQWEELQRTHRRSLYVGRLM